MTKYLFSMVPAAARRGWPRPIPGRKPPSMRKRFALPPTSSRFALPPMISRFALPSMARLRWLVVPALVVSLTACEQEPAGAEAEPAPAGGLVDLTGRVLGPQPGPDRALVEIDNPYELAPNVLQEGRRLFIWFNCYGCHGGRGGGGMGPSLRDVAWLYGSSDEDIFNSIAEGRPHGMPAWGTKLPIEQMWKLTAYIKSMDTPLEPDPPPANPVFPNPPPRRNVPGVKAGGAGE